MHGVRPAIFGCHGRRSLLRRLFVPTAALCLGARLGVFIQRFAQRSVLSTPGFGVVFPLADDEMADTIAAATDAAKAAPVPDPSVLKTNVYADGGAQWRS
jgi:hypothetical protein